MRHGVVIVVLLCASLAHIATGSADSETAAPALRLVAQPGADIHVDADARCQPVDGETYLVIRSPSEKPDRLWFRATGPLRLRDCRFGARFTDSPASLDQFFLLIRRMEYERYQMQVDEHFFEWGQSPHGLPAIRLKRLTDVWPSLVSEPSEVQ